MKSIKYILGMTAELCFISHSALAQENNKEHRSLRTKIKVIKMISAEHLSNNGK